jgi:hypothetical protein
VGIARESVEETLQVLVEESVPADPVGKVVVFGLGGQRAIDEQVGHFEEIAAFGKLRNRISAIAQDSGVTVDVGDRRRTGSGVDVSRIKRDMPRRPQQRRNVDSGGTVGCGDDRKLDLPARVLEGEMYVRHTRVLRPAHVWGLS